MINGFHQSCACSGYSPPPHRGYVWLGLTVENYVQPGLNFITAHSRLPASGSSRWFRVNVCRTPLRWSAVTIGRPHQTSPLGRLWEIPPNSELLWLVSSNKRSREWRWASVASLENMCPCCESLIFLLLPANWHWKSLEWCCQLCQTSLELKEIRFLVLLVFDIRYKTSKRSRIK